MVLAYLALAGGVVVTPDQLVEALWATDPPKSAMKTLHGYWGTMAMIRSAARGLHRAAKR